eukprot:82953_1
MSHIFVLLLYCNLTRLQNKYKSFGCKGNNFNLLKKQNSQIGHWYKLLFEAISIFGEIVKSNDIFYTCMDCKLLFDTFTPIFTYPFSTTT